MDGIIYVGIDPGKEGAIAAIFPDGRIEIRDLPFDKDGHFQCLAFKNMVSEWGSNLAIMFEDPFNKYGRAKVMFMNAGKILGVVESIGHKVNLVTPSKWKTRMELKGSKQASLDMAKILYPDIEEGGQLLRGLRAKRECHDRAEALLLAHFLKENLLWA